MGRTAAEKKKGGEYLHDITEQTRRQLDLKRVLGGVIYTGGGEEQEMCA